MSEVPYKCGIDALVFLSLLDKAEREQRKLRTDITLENILFDVCMVFREKEERVKGKSRKTEVVICKRLFYYLARQKTQHSLEYIGEFMGGRDHTTALHHSRTVAHYLEVKEPKWIPVWNRYLRDSKLFTKNDF